jgi:hypothetical protein
MHSNYSAIHLLLQLILARIVIMKFFNIRRVAFMPSTYLSGHILGVAL